MLEPITGRVTARDAGEAMVLSSSICAEIERTQLVSQLANRARVYPRRSAYRW